MSDRLIAHRAFRYPVGDDARIVTAAGGLRHLSPEAGEAIWARMKVVPVGGDCSDMPEASAAHYLARGEITRVTVTPDED